MGNTGEKYVAQIKRTDLSSKVVIVTGANTGIGYITARELAKMGAQVFIGCRSKERAEEAIMRMKAETPGIELKAHFLALDLNSLSSIEACAAEFQSKNLPLNILVNNAGIMALPDLAHTEDGFEKQFGVNHIGHFHLTTLLLPIIKKSTPARIVNLSSAAHYRGKINWDDISFAKGGYSGIIAYSQSKLANILFTKELQRRFDEEGLDITAYAVHPGFVKTELARNIGVLAPAVDVIATIAAKTVEDGALTSLKVACDPDVEGKKFGGLYWADTEIKEPSEAATNMADAKRLWEVSEIMIAEAKEKKQNFT